MLDQLRKLRLRLLTTPGFRSRAQKLPIIQRFANQSAERVFALCSGFVHSQILFAFVQAGLPERLLDGTRSASELADSIEMPVASMTTLLQAAAALDLCTQVAEEHWELGEVGAVLIGNPGVSAMIRHHTALYQDLADPLNLMRTAGVNSQLQQYWAYANPARSEAPGAADVSAYTQLMAASQQAVAEQTLAAIDLGGCRHLLDVGGGNGSFAVAAARRWPRLRVTVADLPAVTEIARQHVSEMGLNDRIDTVGIDFKQQKLPSGHDALSLVRILHDHDDADVQRLLEAAASSLPERGLLLIAEPLAESTSAGRLLEAYFSLYLLAMGQGRLRRPDELKRMIEAAGFHSVRRASTAMPLISSVICGRR